MKHSRNAAYFWCILDTETQLLTNDKVHVASDNTDKAELKKKKNSKSFARSLDMFSV